MQRFWPFAIYPTLERIKNLQHIIEIGADTGLNTQKILQYCLQRNCKLTSIDPFPSFDYQSWQQQAPEHFQLIPKLSLEALPEVQACEVALIDGDHNWYTVFHELQALAQLNAQAGKGFPIVFFHDIGWPYARRDMYYNPNNIPAEFRQPYRQAGMLPQQSALVEQGGFNPYLYNAEQEGGPRNGVMTAIEDFALGSNLNLSFQFVHGLHGFGVLFENTAENWALFNFPEIQFYAAELAEKERIQYMIQTQQ